jgi:phospho-N-acetylmuramoyl-pentapeptide-transferase
VLHWLLSPLQDNIPTLRLIDYLAFRGAGAAVTALLLSFMVGPTIIRKLQAMKVQQGVRQGTPDTHKGKRPHQPWAA